MMMRKSDTTAQAIFPLGGPREETVSVSPKLAEQWLSRLLPEKQRALRVARVTLLAKMMTNGEWVADHPDPIMFALDGGWLANGQHRLRAVVMSGNTITMRVRRGCTTEEIASIDLNAPRPTHDRLRIAHGTRYSRAAVAAVNVIHLALEHDNILTDAETQSMIDRFADGLEWAIAVTSACDLLRYAPFMAVAAMWYSVNAGVTTAFVERIKSEIPRGKGDPALATMRMLRDHTRRRSGAGGGPRAAVFRMIARAILADVRGEQLHMLTDGKAGIDHLRKALTL